MTVKEYLEIHTNSDIKSVGIYSATPIKDEFNRDTDVIDVDVDAISVIKYLNREVHHVHLGIFDEMKKDIKGNDYKAQFIRACIYIK